MQWRQHTDFDDTRHLLRLQTRSGETHLFDVKTGNTLASLGPEVPRVSGRLTQRDGTHVQLDHLRVCWGDRLLIGTRIQVDGGTLTRERMDAVSLDTLSKMERVPEFDSTGLVFKLRLKNQQEHLFDFTDHPPSICGLAKDGRWMSIVIATISALEI